MDPAVPSERKWDWGIIYCNFWRVSRTFSDRGHRSIGYEKNMCDGMYDRFIFFA